MSPSGTITCSSLTLSVFLFLIPTAGESKNTHSLLVVKLPSLILKVDVVSLNEPTIFEPLTLGWIDTLPEYNSLPKAALKASWSWDVPTPFPSNDWGFIT